MHSQIKYQVGDENKKQDCHMSFTIYVTILFLIYHYMM